MKQTAIFGPFFAMILLTLAVWVYMYSRRIPFLLSLNRDLDHLSRSEFERLSPPSVSNPSNNFRNLFEVPVIFYAVTLYLFVTGQVDSVYVIAAWIFVVFRVAHSAVHCTVNIVKLRFAPMSYRRWHWVSSSCVRSCRRSGSRTATEVRLESRAISLQTSRGSRTAPTVWPKACTIRIEVDSP